MAGIFLINGFLFFIRRMMLSPFLFSMVGNKRFLFSLLFCISTAVIYAQPYGNEWIDYKKTYYKFPVREQRFYRIPQTTLAASGLGNTPVEHFQLWRDGVEVPVFTSVVSGILPTTGYIEFFGKPNSGIHETPLFEPGWHYHPERSLFSDTAYYFLTVNSASGNKRITVATNTVQATTLPIDSFYMATLNPLAAANSHYSGNAILVEGTPFRSANWDIGEGLVSGRFDFTRTLQFNLTSLRAFMNGPAMRIHYTPFGVRNYNRDVILRMNDVEFDRVNLPGITGKDRVLENIPIKGNVVADAINFKLNSSFFDSTDFEQNVLGRFLLTYPRRFFHNAHTPIEISLPANTNGNHIRMQGLPNGTILPVLYDLTHLKIYTGVIKTDSSLFAIEPSPTPRDIVIGTQVANQLRTITTLIPVNFRDFTLSVNQADYLIISNRILRQGGPDPIEAYRTYRSSAMGGSYLAGIYDVDEIADQFCFGVRKNPLGIRRFLFFAADKFSVKPKMAFLIGKGSNYATVFRAAANINREILNSVPTWGTPSSDNLFTARNLKIPVPEIPIGRLSAIYPQEVFDYLDKVKEFESLQKSRPFLASENEWRKRILHLIGGDDVFTANLLGLRMNQNGNLLKNPNLGAQVNQFTRIDSVDFAKNALEVENQLNTGVGLLTYFGHSSTSSIDFNMGSPNLFNNPTGKYPVFMANGCRAGNIFDFNTSRLIAQEVTISENFVLAPKKGSIAFISSSDLGLINYQNLFTREWYQAYNTTQFGKTIGEIQKEAAYRTWLRTSFVNDRLNNFNVEQTILHGDPGIIPFPATLPDFAVESTFINLKPEQVITELDSVEIKLQVFNIGAAKAGQVTVQLERELPNGTVQSLLNKTLTNLYNRDSLTLKLGLKGLFEEGNGNLIARIDPGNHWIEYDKDNNVAVLPFKLERQHILPIFPLNYSIVNSPQIVLKASTTNPVDWDGLYTFQLDTTALFNSPVLITKDTLAKGGLVQWLPLLAYQPSTVYYWRVVIKGAFVPQPTQIFSFLYKPGGEQGFSQSHYYQHKNSTGNQIKLSENRKWSFDKKATNLYVSHGIYLNSGFEDVHFAITFNGQRLIYSACLGRSIIFNLFDPITFEPIRNTGMGDYGSAPVCGPGKEFNFEFRYFPHTNRKTMMDFIDAIPKGTYVAARLVVDPPVDSTFVSFWKRDTTFYGSGNSLYHKLFNQGFYNLDSLNRHRTFFFMFQKDDSSQFKPISQFSRGNRDRVHASVFPTHNDKSGVVSSPWIGPATDWKKATWKTTFAKEADSANTVGRFILWGKKDNGQIVKLETWDSWTDEKDVSHIAANEYPMLRLQMEATGTLFGFEPPQLSFWQVTYTPVTDGAWNPSLHFMLNKDTLRPSKDTLSLQMAFQNIGSQLLGATQAKVYLVDHSGNTNVILQQPFKALMANDTAILNLTYEAEIPEGDYYLEAEVNGVGNPKEQTLMNNRFRLPLVVYGGVLPLWKLSFKAEKTGSSTSLTWQATRDSRIAYYQVEHSGRENSFKTLASGLKPWQQTDDVQKFSFLHSNPSFGENFYRLKIVYKDGSSKFSEIRKVIFDNGNMVRMAPNPFQSYFWVYPEDNLSAWQIQVVDATGKIVLVEKGLGNKKIDLKGLADGLYWVQYTSGNRKEVKKLLKQK